MVRAHVRGRPNFGRMDPTLEQVHIALMAKYIMKQINDFTSFNELKLIL